MLLKEIRDIRATTKEARKFGLTIGLFLLALSGFLFWKGRPSSQAVALAGGAFALLGLAAPILLKPIYKVWMTFAVVMGFIMTRVILSVLFYAIFTPVSVVARLLGRDLLGERLDDGAATYWVRRPSEPFDPKSSERMF